MTIVLKTTKPDMYQQEHPIESEELLLAKLDELDTELEKIPPKEKATYLKAVEKCPQLVTSRKVRLQFLRCEVFNADLAAKRMVAYWDMRLEIFGPDRAFLPLTLRTTTTTTSNNNNDDDDDDDDNDDDDDDKDNTSALTDGDMVALKRGFIRLLPEKGVDPGGRNVLFADPSLLQDRTKYSTLEMARAVWYMIHAALDDDDETTQRKGLILLVYPHKAKIGQFNRELIKTIMGSIRGCLPMRLSALHVCHPPAFFQIIFPIVKVLLGERLRKRINIHFGSQEHVLERLETKFGMPRDKLPTDLGGSIVLDHEKWIEDQRIKEQQQQQQQQQQTE